jgi:hypothetical protein
MTESDKKKIEFAFRNSETFDELLDAFGLALKINLDDIESYKILFANPCLQLDEIKMLAKKVCERFPSLCYGIYCWVGDIFANKKYDSDWRKSAIDFFLKASNEEPERAEPLIKLLELYDHEISLPDNKRIIKEVKERKKFVEERKALYSAFADFYKISGKKELEMKYRRLAGKA